MKIKKTPSKCTGIEEIRMHIDDIDKEIIHLFGLRSKYVHEIVKFKTDEESVIAKGRMDQVIMLRGEWANEVGLDKSTFEQIYQTLLKQNISEELVLLEQQQK